MSDGILGLKGALRKRIEKTGLNPHQIGLILDDYAQEYKQLTMVSEWIEEGNWRKAREVWNDYKGSTITTVDDPSERRLEEIDRLITGRKRKKAMDKIPSFLGERNATYTKFIIKSPDSDMG